MTLAQIGALLTEIKAAISGAPALASENAELKLKLAASTSENERLTAALATKDAEIATAKADATKAQDEAKAAVDAKAAAETALAELKANPSEQARHIVASAGVKPEDRPTAAAANPATANLKGLARTIAALKAQAAK